MVSINDNAQKLLLDMLARGGFLKTSDVHLDSTKSALQDLGDQGLVYTVFDGHFVLTIKGTQVGENLKQAAF